MQTWHHHSGAWHAADNIGHVLINMWHSGEKPGKWKRAHKLCYEYITTLIVPEFFISF